MKRLPYMMLVGIGLVSTVASGELFLLQPEGKGKPLGPFEFKDNLVLSLGGTNYTVKVQAKSSIPIEQKLQTIVIPSVEFRQADIRDVIEYLRQISSQLDPEKLGVNFVFMPLRPATTYGKTGNPVVQNAEYPRITMNIRDITLQDAVSLIMDITQYKYAVKNNAVTIYPKGY